MAKLIRIRSWEGLVRASRAGRQDFFLARGILRASHAFELRNGKVEDWSMVDGSIIRYTKAEFLQRYGPAMKNGALFSDY